MKLTVSNSLAIPPEKQAAYLSRFHKILNHGKYVYGPEVEELEEKLGKYVGRECVSCGSGTDGLVMALRVLGIGKQDAVFVPAFSFIASASSILLAGGNPVFVDVKLSSFNICPIDLESQIKAVLNRGEYRPKAIIAVNLFGLPADYNSINKIAKKYDMYVVEDAAQSFGAEYYGKVSGSLGDIGVTSFYPTKPFSCFGDGGAIFVKNKNWANTLRQMRNHGLNKAGKSEVLGMNSRLDSFQAAVLLERWKSFDKDLEERRKKAEDLWGELSVYPLFTKQVAASQLTTSGFSLALFLKEKVEGLQIIKTLGLLGNVYYSEILPEIPHFKNYNIFSNTFRISKELKGRICALKV